MKKPEPAPAEANPFRRAVFMVPILRTWLPLPLGTEKNPTMTLKFKKNCLDIGVHYTNCARQGQIIKNNSKRNQK